MTASSQLVVEADQITRLNDLTVVAGNEAWLRENDLASLDALFSYSRGQSLHKPGLATWRERFRLVVTDGSGRRTIYLKRFSHPPANARREIRRSASGAGSVAGLEWQWMQRLAREGIPSVPPIAFGEEVGRSGEVRSAIVTAEVPGESLERMLAAGIDLRFAIEDRVPISCSSDGSPGAEQAATAGSPRGLKPAARNTRDENVVVPAARNITNENVVASVCGNTGSNVADVWEPLADLISRFHHAGYVHRDLYLSHIFFDPSAPPGQALHLIDVQRVLRPTRMMRRWVVKDLAALNHSAPAAVVSNAMRLRWLKRYLGVSRLNRDWKRLVYGIIGKTVGMARHDRRRLARLSERV